MQSQQRAAKAWDDGRFAKSVVPVNDVNGLTILARDEHMRPTTNMQSLAGVPIEIISIIQGLVIVFVAAPAVIRWIYRIRVRTATTVVSHS